MSIWVQTRREAGRIGGLVRSERKAKAARENGKLGGRPFGSYGIRKRFPFLPGQKPKHDPEAW